MRNGRWWDVLRMRFRSLAKRKRVETELDKELRYHMQRQTEENIAAGMNAREAREAASRMFGGVTQIEEECRDMRQTQYLENFLQDLRYAVRMLGKSPSFTLVIVLTLALSIGANSAIFSVIDGVLLKPLPYPQADRIARVFYKSAEYPKFPVNPWDFLDFRARNRSFENFAMYTHADVQLSGTGGDPVKLSAFRISSGYFRVLGLRPARGREFDFSEERPGNGNVVILSDRLWRNQFGAAADILGRKLLLDSQPFTVVGVMPPGVDHPGNSYNSVAYGDTVDAWTAFTFEGNPSRGPHYVEGIGRLKPGVTVQQAASDFNGIMTELASQHEGDKGYTIYMVPLFQEIVGPVQKMLLVLLGAVGLVLLLACVNAANLLLARAAGRQKEIAVRAALGAGRGRLARQMLAESLVISLLGGALGALLAIVGVRVLVSFLPQGFPRTDAIQVNGFVFAFTALVAVATGLFFGLIPAVKASRTDPQRGLHEGGRGSSGSGRQTRLRAVLVVAEVALAFLLLVGAGAMLRSFVNLLRLDPGFQAAQVLTAEVALPGANYKTHDSIAGFYQKLLANLNALPGVHAVGAGTDLPWTGYDENVGGFTIEGKAPPPHEEFHARFHSASPDYFRAVGIPLVRGRFFDLRDTKDAPKALIINDEMARRYWPGEDAVGKRVSFDDKPKEADWLTVVGVVGDVKDKPENAGAEPAFWLPLAQGWLFGGMRMTIAMRANGDATPLTDGLRSVVRELDPSLAVAHVRVLDRIIEQQLSTPRFALFLIGLFAALALLLAAIGIYGVISYSVSQRMHEFGMRVALGASSWNLIRMVMKQGVLLTLVGVALGLGCALIFGGVLDSLLYGVSARDPLTLVGVGAMAVITATLACLPSARRATSADPMTSLRTE